VGSRWCNDEFENPQSTTLDENTHIITPSRESTIYYTRGQHTHHYTIENPQSTTLKENTLIITLSRTHNLLQSRRTQSSLHNGEPTIYHTRGEYTHHYTIENPQSTTLDENTLIITPSRTHNLLHSRRKHSLHHREPTIYHTLGEHIHHYTIENPQSTTLEENTLIITPSRTHNLPHSRRTHSSLHHRETPIYHTRGEHTHYYTIENPQYTTLEENILIITPSRTHNLLHSKRTHSSLHHREPTIYHSRGDHTHHYTMENPQSTTLEENTLIITWVIDGVMMSVFSSTVVDCGFSMA
jgi:hypothetical protein